MDLVWIKNSQGAPKWVKDPGNGLKSIRGSGGYHLGSISVVFGPFGGLRKAPKPDVDFGEVQQERYLSATVVSR